MLAFDDLLEATDGLLDRHIAALETCKLLGYAEGLGHEALYLTSTGYDELILVRELVHTQDGDDVLQLLVTLQDLLNLTRYIVMLETNHLGGEDGGAGIQRVYRRVDALGRNVTGQYGGGIQV